MMDDEVLLQELKNLRITKLKQWSFWFGNILLVMKN